MSAPVARMVSIAWSGLTAVDAVAAQSRPRSVDRLARRNGVAFDARNLHRSPDRIAGQAEAVLYRDLGRVLHLLRCATEDFGLLVGGVVVHDQMQIQPDTPTAQ